MRAFALVPIFGVAFASSAAAQARRADSLLAAGRLVAAESVYYAGARARPRDPEARRQLGRFLGQRGAIRVGAVLLEEARTFGGDAATIARDLVPLYRALDDYHALVVMPASPLGDGDRAQAQWLVEHPPALEAGDSATVAYRPVIDGAAPGRVTLRIDGHSVDAMIDPSRRGIVVDSRGPAVPRRRFRQRADGSVPAVADTVQMGTLKMVNVPVSIDSLMPGIDAVLGIDVLQRYAATFDPTQRRIVLHPGGTVPATMAGVRVATLTTPSDVRVLQGNRFVSFGAPSLAGLLRTKRWTLDARRGAIVIE
jgi:hypothetical protein